MVANHQLRSFLAAGWVFLMVSCSLRTSPPPSVHSPLAGKIIVVDPGHGGTAATDHFRVGPSGQREEWVNLRVAEFLKEMLEARKATVLMTRTDDVAVELKDRAMIAVDNHADVFLSIHHNATADPTVNFPIVYYHANASGNPASVALATHLGRRIAKSLYRRDPPISIVSDHTIFPGSGAAVLRHSFGIPGVIGEATFFSNPREDERLRHPEYNRREAAAYVRALEDFFAAPPPPALDRYNKGRIPPMETLQEAERMEDTAKRWREDFDEGEELLQSAQAEGTSQTKADELREQALALFSRSARSFPDSPVARQCHIYMAEILQDQGKTDVATLERRRVEEYYVPIED